MKKLRQFNSQSLLFSLIIFVLVLTFGTKVFAATNPGRHIGVDVFWDENGITVDSNFDLLLPNQNIIVNPPAEPPSDTTPDNPLPVVLAPIVTLTVNGSSSAIINSQGSAILTWSSTHANSCTTINTDPNYINPISTSGSAIVHPIATTTTYNINCVGATGTPPATTSVTVSILDTTLTVNGLSSATINSGETATLVWTSTNATSCDDQGTGYNPGLNGSAIVHPTTDTVYKIRCYDATKTVSAYKQVSITVASPPTPTPTIEGTAEIRSGFIANTGTDNFKATFKPFTLGNPSALVIARNFWGGNDQMPKAHSLTSNSFSYSGDGTTQIDGCKDSSTGYPDIVRTARGVTTTTNRCGVYYIGLTGQVKDVITGGFHANYNISSDPNKTINQVNFPAGSFTTAPTAVILSRNWFEQSEQMPMVMNITKDGFQYTGDLTYIQTAGVASHLECVEDGVNNPCYYTTDCDDTSSLDLNGNSAANWCGVHWIAIKGNVTDAIRSGTGEDCGASPYGDNATGTTNISSATNLKAIVAAFGSTGYIDGQQDIYSIFNIVQNSFQFSPRVYCFGSSTTRPFFWVGANGNFKINKYSNGSLGTTYQ